MPIMNTDTATQPTHLVIPSSRLCNLTQKVSVLNGKAKRYGINPIVLEIGKEEVVEHDECRYLVTHVTIQFDPIVVAGDWTFLASIEHDMVNNQYRNVVSSYGLSKEDEVKYRCIESGCDHCKVNRFRNLTYIVKSAEGELKQVGSSCLKDHVRVESLDSVLKSLRIMSELSDTCEEFSDYRSGGSVTLPNLKMVVDMSVAVISGHGFVSKAKSEIERSLSTSTFVNMQLYPPFQYKKEVFPTDEHGKVADDIINRWKETLVPKFDSNSDELDSFQFKIAMAVSLGYVKWNTFSTLVAGVSREMTLIEKEKAPKVEYKNEFVPNVKEKDRIDLELTVVRINKFNGEYGITSIVNFVDSENRKVVWFASGDIYGKEWEVGSSLKVKATIKSFKDDPKYGKQTMVTRVSLLKK